MSGKLVFSNLKIQVSNESFITNFRVALQDYGIGVHSAEELQVPMKKSNLFFLSQESTSTFPCPLKKICILVLDTL